MIIVENGGTNQFMRISIFIIVMAVASVSHGQEKVSFEDGAELTSTGSGLTLVVDGKTAWTKKLEDARPDAKAALTSHVVADGQVAVHAVYPLADGKTGEVVFLRQNNRKALRAIWQEKTGLRGDVGEQTSPKVRFVDLTSDGVPEIVTGQVLESVRLCGQDTLPLLFRRVYDFKSRKFKPVLAPRPGIAGAVEISGGEAPSDGVTSPVARNVVPRAASRMAGDDGEPIMLSPPLGIADRDPRTAWVPATGNGAGEFATLEVLTSAYGIKRVGVRPLPEVERPGSYDRPKTLYLVTEKGVYRLLFPEDPVSNPGEPVWFELAEPESTSCLSLVVESSYAPSRRRKMAIAELIVITEADGPEGIKKLVADLSDSKKRFEAAQMLLQAGEKAVSAFREQWDQMDWQAKKRAARVIADRAPAKGADILAGAVMEGDPEVAKPARKGLARAGDAAVPYLVPHLSGESDDSFKTAATVLTNIGSLEAVRALARAAGKGDGERRGYLRGRLGLAMRRVKADKNEKVGALFEEVEAARAAGDMERTLDLLRVAVGIRELAGPVAEVATALYEKSDSFDDRYRLLLVFAALGCDAPFSLVRSAAMDQDKHIRTVAMRGLYGCEDRKGKGLMVLTKSLDDEAPQVRLAALKAMLSNGLPDGAADKVAMLATTDPWADIRERSVSNARHMKPEAAAALLYKTQVDPSLKVRVATVRTAIKIPGKPIDKILVNRLSDNNEKSKAKRIAAYGVGVRCLNSALPVLYENLKKGAEPLASQGQIAVARAAAKAMGNIGTKEALGFLEEVRERSNPATDRAIDAALKSKRRLCIDKTEPQDPRSSNSEIQ